MLIPYNEIQIPVYKRGKKKIAQHFLDLAQGNYEQAKKYLEAYIKVSEYQQRHCFDRQTKSKFVHAEFMLNTKKVKFAPKGE